MGAKSDLTQGQVHMQVYESTILAVNMSCMTKYSLASHTAKGVACKTRQSSLVPRPHPLTRRNGLVNQVKFLGLVHTFATM